MITIVANSYVIISYMYSSNNDSINLHKILISTVNFV